VSAAAGLALTANRQPLMRPAMKATAAQDQDEEPQEKLQ
jgi:hypothetical protein